MSTRLAALAVVTCLLSACGDGDGLFAHADRSGRVVHTVLPVARDLREGAPVRYRGIEVGKVTTVRIVDSGVRLDLRIERADAPLRSGDRVRPATVGIFGEQEVEIVPGPVSAPRLAPNAWLAAVPPDTLAVIRDAVIGAIVRNAFDRFGAHDSAARSQQHADSVHPPTSRPYP